MMRKATIHDKVEGTYMEYRDNDGVMEMRVPLDNDDPNRHVWVESESFRSFDHLLFMVELAAPSGEFELINREGC